MSPDVVAVEVLGSLTPHLFDLLVRGVLIYLALLQLSLLLRDHQHLILTRFMPPHPRNLIQQRERVLRQQLFLILRPIPPSPQ